MFCDELEIKVKAGDGGDGLSNFLHEKYREFGGPDGGDGGKGGDVIFRADERLNTLYYFKSHKFLKAKDGENGKKRKQRGKKGENIIIQVPVGTIIMEGEKQKTDLYQKGMEAIVAIGGEGGFGNAHFSTSVRQAPKVAEVGIKGEEKDIFLKLKLVADVGLIGLPNAGKSTFLSVVSKAKPKIADYPFTTIIPNLGVVEGFGIREGEGFVAADMPGLIKGASLGKGLGDQFLKHIERTKVILHLIDINSDEMIANFEIINKELEDYMKSLIEKPQIVVVTKIDSIDPEKAKEKIESFKKYLSKQKKVNLASKRLYLISSVSHSGLKEVIFETKKALENFQEKEIKEKEEDYKIFTIEDVKKDIFTISKEGSVFRVKGKKIERFALKTDFENSHSVARLNHIIERIGIKKELEKKGAKDGDTIIIAEKELEFRE